MITPAGQSWPKISFLWPFAAPSAEFTEILRAPMAHRRRYNGINALDALPRA
jgi:hypothetical protein